MKLFPTTSRRVLSLMASTDNWNSCLPPLWLARGLQPRFGFRLFVKLKRGLRLDCSKDMMSANSVNKLAVPDGVVKREENKICPLVFERLKITLNIYYCFGELLLSANTEVTHQLYGAASWHTAGAVQVLSMGVVLCRWPVQINAWAKKKFRSAEEGGSWCSLELLILSLESLGFVSCSVFISHQTKKSRLNPGHSMIVWFYDHYLFMCLWCSSKSLFTEVSAWCC